MEQTQHQRLKGRTFRKLLPVFAEHVLYLPMGKRASRLVGAMYCFSELLREVQSSTWALRKVSCEPEVCGDNVWNS